MKKFLLSLLVLGLCVPGVALAVEDSTIRADEPAVKNYLKEPYRSVPGLINAVLELIVQIGSVVLVIAVVMAGFQYVKARGNPGEIEKAHQTILYTLIGAAIVLGAFVISEGIQATVSQLSV